MIDTRALRQYQRSIWEITHVAFRHILLPINAIIVSVVILLIVFGEMREGIFLGVIVILNFVFGFVQDVRAWLLLERLQLLAAIKVTRIRHDGTLEEVMLEDIAKGDRIKLALGDQMPCDGLIISSTSLEVNEGLITGESDSFRRKEGDTILAGSIVTSGIGQAQVETSFENSRMAQMTIGLKRYEANPSPIQRSIDIFIRYTVYVLSAVAALIVVRGILIHSPEVHMVEQIGAIASVLVPQGLVVSTTLLFSFGAGYFFRRNILLQEVNATEKLGRIKNLCMDKTGTLTHNHFTVETMRVDPSTLVDDAKRLAALYVRYSGDSSKSITAVTRYVGEAEDLDMQDVLSFSSWRGYGGIAFTDVHAQGVDTVVLMGATEPFLAHVKDPEQRNWMIDFSEAQAREGKHILCIVRAVGSSVPEKLEGAELTAVAILVLDNKLRDGVREAIAFFQERGTRIRIISGDNPKTVLAIAERAGIQNPDSFITGPEMEGWNESDYIHNAAKYTIFARTQPEQKEHIIEALKLDGFTAMVGDGANDALSMKKADLGIAMLAGTQATRQVAAVVLANNDFSELPAGVRLADSVIENIELFATIFLAQTFIDFLVFVGLTLFGIDFPLNPLNIALMNYFSVGFPSVLIFYWAMNPPETTTPSHALDFLKRVMPFSLALSAVQGVAALAVFAFGSIFFPTALPASLLVIFIILSGFTFFVLASGIFGGVPFRKRWQSIVIFGTAEAALLSLAFTIPFVSDFFGVTMPPLGAIVLTLFISGLSSIAQYAVVKMFFANESSAGNTN